MPQVRGLPWGPMPERQAQQENPERRFWGLPERASAQVRGLPWELLPQGPEQAWGLASAQVRGPPWELLPERQARQEKPERPLSIPRSGGAVARERSVQT